MSKKQYITGKVRGLLCNGCNSADGFLSSDLNKIIGLAEYLKKIKDRAKEYPGMSWYNT